MLELVHSFWPTATRLDLLLLMFVIYVISIVIFGIAYHRIYGTRKKSFFVQSAIDCASSRYRAGRE